MRIHKEERKYLCPDCGYKCKWVNQLKYHMTKHTGECGHGAPPALLARRGGRGDALQSTSLGAGGLGTTRWRLHLPRAKEGVWGGFLGTESPAEVLGWRRCPHLCRAEAVPLR